VYAATAWQHLQGQKQAASLNRPVLALDIPSAWLF
jgi:hypothetical protein